MNRTVARLCKAEKIGGIVIGESKNFEGKDNPIMKKAEAFAAALRAAGLSGAKIKTLKDLSLQNRRLPGVLQWLDLSTASALKAQK